MIWKGCITVEWAWENRFKVSAHRHTEPCLSWGSKVPDTLSGGGLITQQPRGLRCRLCCKCEAISGVNFISKCARAYRKCVCVKKNGMCSSIATCVRCYVGNRCVVEGFTLQCCLSSYAHMRAQHKQYVVIVGISAGLESSTHCAVHLLIWVWEEVVASLLHTAAHTVKYQGSLFWLHKSVDWIRCGKKWHRG